VVNATRSYSKSPVMLFHRDISLAGPHPGVVQRPIFVPIRKLLPYPERLLEKAQRPCEVRYHWWPCVR